MKVLKRDGSLERFSKTKIRKSLMKAFKTSKTKFCQDCYDETIKDITERYEEIDGGHMLKGKADEQACRILRDYMCSV